MFKLNQLNKGEGNMNQVEALSLIVKAKTIDDALYSARLHGIESYYDIYRIGERNEIHIKVLLNDYIEKNVQSWFNEQSYNNLIKPFPDGTLLTYSYHYETVEL